MNGHAMKAVNTLFFILTTGQVFDKVHGLSFITEPNKTITVSTGSNQTFRWQLNLTDQEKLKNLKVQFGSWDKDLDVAADIYLMTFIQEPSANGIVVKANHSIAKRLQWVGDLKRDYFVAFKLFGVKLSDSGDYGIRFRVDVSFPVILESWFTLSVQDPPPLPTKPPGYDAQIIRVSSDPVRAFEGSNALFQWVLSNDLTSRPDFQGLVFGLWKNGYLAIYLITVTKARRIILNPGLKDEAPQLDGRVQWKGDLSKSLAAFQISQVNAKDQMDYGIVLDFGPYRNSLSDSIRLEVKERTSFITALPSAPVSVGPGKNVTFHCQFHVHEKDKTFYEGVTVGVLQRGGISLTLMTVASNRNIIINPELAEEGPEYNQRVHALLSTNKTNNNTSIISVKLTDVNESHEKSYGCSMYFGPYREPVVSSVSIDVQDSNSNNGISSQSNSSQDSLEVRVGKNIMIPCPVFAEVIQQDGAFKATYWSYCASKSCTTIETKWLWLAGMNSDRETKVTDSGRYSNRVNLTRNGTLEINSVQMADTTDYRCTVTRINYTSPLVYFVSLLVNTSVPPTVAKRSRDKVTVVEGNALYLLCEAEGNPTPLVTWKKQGKLLQSRFNETNFIVHEARNTDAGIYECKASNSVGSVSYKVEVTIKPKDDEDDKTLTKTGVILLAFGLCVLAVLVVMTVVACRLHKKTRQRQDYNKV